MTEETLRNDTINDPFHIDDFKGKLYEQNADYLKQKDEPKLINSKIQELVNSATVESYFFNAIHQNVSHYDDHVISMVFYSGLSAYLKPLNIALKAESGAGKTYSTTETIKYFPQEDVNLIGSQSPKVISHELGVYMSADGEPLSEEPPEKPTNDGFADDVEYKTALFNWKNTLNDWKEKRKTAYYQVDLRYKITVFLESINIETFKMLKATMSHDCDEEGFIHKYVDDKGKVHRTKLIGSPVMVFNSLDNAYMSEFATRTLTVTPDTSLAKIQEAMEISNRKASSLTETGLFERKVIQEYIRQIAAIIKSKQIKSKIPFTNLKSFYSAGQTRDMRDFNHFLELIPSVTLFNFYQRPIIQCGKEYFILSTVDDVLKAKEIFDAISATTKSGTEQRIVNFYVKYCKDRVNGATVKGLTDAYNKDNKKKLSTRTVRDWLDRLITIEWLDEREDEQVNSDGFADHKTKTYYPLKTDKLDNIADFGTAINLTVELEKDVENWLKYYAGNISFPHCFILKIDGKAIRLSTDELLTTLKSQNKELIKNSGGNQVNPAIYSMTKQSLKSENKPENIAVQQSATLQANSEDNSKITTYRQLAPNQIHQCEGNHNNAIEAQYELGNLVTEDKTYYCEACFRSVAKNSADNGFTMLDIAKRDN